MCTVVKIWLTPPPPALDGIYLLYSVRFMLKAYSYKCHFVLIEKTQIEQKKY